MMITEQTNHKIANANNITNRLIYFFVFLLLISIAGFYKTYLIKFPTFDGFNWAHHFHGAIMLLWIFMLIAQPIFIRTKNMKWHRIVGKASYFIFPLLILSFFLVGRAAYFRNLSEKGEVEALAGIGFSGIPDMFYISILYGLGIYYKKITAYHLRFFASIGLMILGPGLGRFLIAVCGFPPQIAILGMILSISVITLVWMIIDIRAKKSAFPMGVFLGIIAVTFIVGPNSHSAWWQSFAKWIVMHLF